MSQFLPIENQLTPFMLESANVRGRVVRLGAVADEVLSRYAYPAPVRQLLGELLVTVAMLSANLKQEGIFTIQIRGKGLIPLLVVDAVYGGALRGYAELSDAAVEAIGEIKDYSPQALVGEGAYLAITLDPGVGMQRYQGIVALEGNSIAEALFHYFNQSQQMDVQLKLAVREHAPYTAAGMMVERMPETSSHAVELNQEAWRYAQAMLATLAHDELLDPLLDAPTLLYRLFHEEGVIVYDAQPLAATCRCSRERISTVLMGMSITDRADMIVDGKASVNCQFCNTTELFTLADLGLTSV